jgi:hypothetical protein
MSAACDRYAGSLLGLPATTSMPSMGVPQSCRSVANSKRSTLHESFRALRAIRGYVIMSATS